MITEEQFKRIADLWLAESYSPMDIRQETGITLDDIEIAIQQIKHVCKIIHESLLRQIIHLFDMEA